MKQNLIRYKTKPERADENEALVGAVFEQLHATSPDGIHYLVLRLADGAFVHLVKVDPTANIEALTKLEAFRSFQDRASERYLEAPQSSEAKIVGNYRTLIE
jgi:hypothetical protein